MTEITTLAPADRAMIVLSSSTTEAQLRGMAQDAASITDVIDPDGREQAHRMGMRLRTARTTIEKAGKAARDDANAFAKAVIDEQKRLIGITEGEERRIIGLRVGCFFGDVDTFRAKLAETHGDNDHAAEYRAALTLIEKHAEIWTPKESAITKATGEAT